MIATRLSKPMFFARREKRYPEAPILEGIKETEIYRKRVLIIDETIVKGWTKKRVAYAIREAGGICGTCFVILDREQGSKEELKKDGIELSSLTDLKAFRSPRFPPEISLLTRTELKEIKSYLKNPKFWHEKKVFKYYELKPR